MMQMQIPPFSFYTYTANLKTPKQL